MSIHNATDRAVLAALGTSQRLSTLEEQSLRGLTGDDYERAHAQLMLQKQQETVAFVANLLKNDGTMQVIGKLG